MTDTQASSETEAPPPGGADTPESSVPVSPAYGTPPVSAPPADDAARGAVGRASVPGDKGGSAPKFTRAPGMMPPPDSLTVPVQPAHVPSGVPHIGGVPTSAPPSSGAPAGAAGSASVTGTASVPGAPTIPRDPTIPNAAAVARASVRATGTIPVRTPGTTTGRLGAAGLGAPGLGAPGVGMPGVGMPGAPGTGHPGTGTPGAPTPGATGAARVTEAVRAARATVAAAAGRGPRRARLHLKRVDPWSVMKFAFAVSFVLFVVVIIATAVLYVALDAMGVFDSVNSALGDFVSATGSDGEGGFVITAKGVIGGAALLGLVNVVLFTALATLGAFIYNVCADLVGGIELTLSEKE
jgi:hypothetical protein